MNKRILINTDDWHLWLSLSLKFSFLAKAVQLEVKFEATNLISATL